MIVRILGVQTKTNLGLWTLMKVMLRMVMTMFTKLPVTSNMTIRTTEGIMKHMLLNRGQHLLE